MTDLAISIQNVSKGYSLDNKKAGSAVVARRASENKFWALRDININVYKGDVVGLIGSNGAGKSTLLKILSGITKPSEGQISIKGNVGSMLEVGTGFSPELTGRENILLSGTLLGMEKARILDRMNAIIEFSGIENFIETPVKYYSSGMYVRLAFSILVYLDTDILLLDEVLGVGDADFRIKTAQTILNLVKSGRTVILASHDPREIQTLCSRVVWIDNSCVKFDGSTSDGVEQYLLKAFGQSEAQDQHSSSSEHNPTHQQLTKKKFWTDSETAPGNPDMRLINISVSVPNKLDDEDFFMEDEISLQIEFYKRNDERSNEIILHLHNISGVHVLTDCITLRYQDFNHTMPRGKYKLSGSVPAYLLNHGTYVVSLAFTKNMRNIIHEIPRILFFQVKQNPKFAVGLASKEIFDMNESINSVVKPLLKWELINESKHSVLAV